MLIPTLVALLLLAQPARAEGSPRIVNGVLAWDPPSVGALLCRSETSPSTTNCSDHSRPPATGPFAAGCSGTLVGCQTFVTAAHCVCNLPTFEFCTELEPRDPSRLAVFLQHAGVFAVESIDIHPGWERFPQGIPAFDYDVAVLKLSTPVSGIGSSALNELATPNFGTSGTIVGFGLTGPGAGDAGLKRKGTVVTDSCDPDWPDDGHVCWSFEEPLDPPGEDSNICYADSGGPLFADLGAGSALAGMTSAGNADCLAPEHSLDLDVFTVRDFVAAAAGADLGTCGDEAPTPSVELSGSVGPEKPEARHEFDLPADATLLRLTLNGTGSNLGRDFDLYAKVGAPATPAAFDCAIAGPGQFGVCEVQAPASGTWNVLVTHVAEAEGGYQVTVVEVPEPGEALLVLTGATLMLAARSRKRTASYPEGPEVAFAAARISAPRAGRGRARGPRTCGRARCA
jgi:hypothetical protein